MVYGIYQSAGGMQVNQYAMEILANNLANVATSGFKHDLALVRERMIETRERPGSLSVRHPVLDDMTGGSLVAPTFTSFEQGAIEVTHNPLDVALEGEGFFTVQRGNEVRYTRDGRFTLNKDGELVTVAGSNPVLDEQGLPIRIDPAARGSVRIDADGTVRAGKSTAGRLGIVDFEDKSLLRKTGGNMLQNLGPPPQEAQARLRVGATESSTVDAATTLVQLMQATRAYELNGRLVGLADSTLGRAVNDIARIR